MGAAGFDGVVRHIADLDAPVVRIVAAAFAENGAAIAARADASGEVAFVFLEPVGDLLDLDGLVVHLDLLLDGDDVHADAVSSRHDHRCDVL